MRFFIILFLGLLFLGCSKDTPSPVSPTPPPSIYGSWLLGPIDSADGVSYKAEWTFYQDRYTGIKYRTDSRTNQTSFVDSGTMKYLPGRSFPSFIFFSDPADTTIDYGYHYKISGDSLFLRGVNPHFDSLTRVTGSATIIGRWFDRYSCGHGCDSLFLEYTQDSIITSGLAYGRLGASPCSYPGEGEYVVNYSDSTAAWFCYSISDNRLYLFEADDDVMKFKRLR